MNWILLGIFQLNTAFAGEEVRESYDNQGHPIRRIVWRDGSIIEEQVSRFEGERLIERVTVASGKTVVERWLLAPDGAEIVEVDEDGKFLRKETTRRMNGKIVEIIREAAGKSAETTFFRYDSHGNLTESTVQWSDGTILSRTIADRTPPAIPPVPIRFTAEAGATYNSMVDTTDVYVGFSVVRKPSLEQYATDPLEIRAGMTYRLGLAKGEKTNDELTANVGLDYNHLVKRMSLFLFTNLMRNPTANLEVDVILAPLGIKYDILDTPHWTLDASFAPVWNFRSIVTPVGAICETAIGSADTSTVLVDTPCITSKFRGSFRARVGYQHPKVKINNTLEYLPNLRPTDGYPKGLATDSVLKNTLGLEVILTSRLSLKQALTVQRDLTLASQADCSSDPNNLLCKGLSVGTMTSLALNFDVVR